MNETEYKNVILHHATILNYNVVLLIQNGVNFVLHRSTTFMLHRD